MIRHKNRGQHVPTPQFRDRVFERGKGAFIGEDWLAMRYTDGDKIDDRLFPAQPNRNPGG
jgi:hypothetical protein